MKKNILISVFDMEIGGIERSLINLLETFDYEKYNVDLLIYDHKGDLFNFISKKANILPENKSYSVFRRPIKDCLKEGYVATSIIRLISKLISQVKAKAHNFHEGPGYVQMQLALKYSVFFLPEIRKQYDLAISYAWPHDVVAKKVKANKKIAWIHTDYSQLEVDRKIDLSTWSEFDYISSISEDCTKAFIKMYPSLKHKIIQIENINSPEFIRKMSTSGNSEILTAMTNERTFKIVSVGRLSFAKGFDLAIEALKELYNEGYQHIKWYVIGFGTEETRLRELIVKNELTNHFILLGKQTNPYPYMNACDLYVQPSRYEGKAVTVTEAKTLGKPVLLTNYPTANSQVEHGVDGLICPLSVEGIVSGIKHLMNDEDLRIKLAFQASQNDYKNSEELDKIYQLI